VRLLEGVCRRLPQIASALASHLMNSQLDKETWQQQQQRSGAFNETESASLTSCESISPEWV
jgi:hypothetical protein